MNFKKSKIYFLCTILTSVSFLAQISAVKASEVDEVVATGENFQTSASFLTQVSAVRASEVDEVVVTGENFQVTVDLAKQQLQSALFCEDVSSIDNSLEKMEKMEETVNYASLIRSLVGSPIEESKFSKPAGWSRIGIVQRLENLRTVDLAQDPHASDYYTFLPEGLDGAHPNLKYYQWLSQVVYVVHGCLQNKLIDPTILQAGYSSYFSKGISGFEWLLTAPAYFEQIYKYLEKADDRENPYSHLNPLYEQKKSELLATLVDRVMLSSAHPTIGERQFFVFNANTGADTLLSALGFSYDESLQTLLDAITDGRLLIKDKPGFYDNLNRRIYMANGGEEFVKQQIVLFLNHYTALAEQDSLAWIGTLLKGMGHIGVASDANEKLKSEHGQQLIDHEAKAPYLSEIGVKPQEEAELSSWNTRLTEWKATHQVEFDAWQSEKSLLLKERDNQHFSLIYNAILSRINQDTKGLSEFVRKDFSSLFKDAYVDLDPTDLFQAMAYIQPLLTFSVRNLVHWQLGKNSQDELQIMTDWAFTLSPLVYEVNVLKTVNESGHVHYMKLISPNDYIGIAKAARAERASDLPKITTLTQNGVPKSVNIVSGYR